MELRPPKPMCNQASWLVPGGMSVFRVPLVSLTSTGSACPGLVLISHPRASVPKTALHAGGLQHIEQKD